MEGGGSGGARDGATIGIVAIPMGNGGAAGSVPDPKGGAMGIELPGEAGTGTVGATGGAANMVPPGGGGGATGMVTAGD